MGSKSLHVIDLGRNRDPPPASAKTTADLHDTSQNLRDPEDPAKIWH